MLDPAAFEELDGSSRRGRGRVLRQGAPDPQREGRRILARGRSQDHRGRPSPSELEAYFLSRGLTVFDRLAGLKVPTVAVVHGVCLGGGLELALACRFRVALASGHPAPARLPRGPAGPDPGLGRRSPGCPGCSPPGTPSTCCSTGNPIGFLQAKSQGLVDRLVTEEEQDRIAETLNRVARTDRDMPATSGATSFGSRRPRPMSSRPISPKPSSA